jgi:hypothetical protein
MDTCICIPTKRPPPVQTLLSYCPPLDYTVIIIADPDVEDAHRCYFEGVPNACKVVRGVKGMGAQSAECYVQAAIAGFPFFFRMDDDLAPKTFVRVDDYPELDVVMHLARECLDATKTTHAGFCNTSRRDWLGEGYGRTYGLIHGGGNIATSAMDPTEFMDRTLVRGEDVYRTCAHRQRDGAVGRVKSIGFDKSKSTRTAGNTSIVNVTQEQLDASRDLILAKFPGMVTCKGTRWINNGQNEIPNWRMKR